MSTKKTVAKAAPKKRKTGLAMMAKKAVTTRKKRKQKPKSALSEMVSADRAKKTGGAILSGASGGAIIHVVDQLMPDQWGNGARVLTGLITSFVFGAVLDKPNMAAGMAGAVGYKFVDSSFLSEGDDTEMEEGEFTDADILEEMPEYLSADGGALMEDARGNLYSLSESGRMQYYAPYNRQA